LEELICLALPLCREAQKRCPRTGPGRKPLYQDWQLAALILCGVLKKKKSKSSQYRLIQCHQKMLLAMLEVKRLPARSTFCDRYKKVWPLVSIAIRLQGQKAIDEHVIDAQVVAADKSVLRARGPCRHRRPKRKSKLSPKRLARLLRAIDVDADWGYSGYHGWVWGYSYEVVVSATRSSITFPLLASVGKASASEHATFSPKIEQLPHSTREVLADSGYDDNNHLQKIEQPTASQTPTRQQRLHRRSSRQHLAPARCGRSGNLRRRRFLCPPQRGWIGKTHQSNHRERLRQRRLKSFRFLKSRRGRTLYMQRGQTVEPFNALFKNLFDLHEHVWHRGLQNNCTQVLLAIFAYQLLIRYHCKHGADDAQIQRILDEL
jgi:hypothetical protein